MKLVALQREASRQWPVGRVSRLRVYLSCFASRHSHPVMWILPSLATTTKRNLTSKLPSLPWPLAVHVARADGPTAHDFKKLPGAFGEQGDVSTTMNRTTRNIQIADGAR